MRLALRFDMRAPSIGAPAQDLYAASIDMAAWADDPFEYRGQTVVIRPTPMQKPRPPLYIGGSTEASARRAARLGDNYLPATPGLLEIYQEERRRLGLPVPAPPPPRGPLFLFVS